MARRRTTCVGSFHGRDRASRPPAPSYSSPKMTLTPTRTAARPRARVRTSVRRPQALGPPRAKVLGWTGRWIDARVALARGSVDEVVPRAQQDVAVVSATSRATAPTTQPTASAKSGPCGATLPSASATTPRPRLRGGSLTLHHNLLAGYVRRRTCARPRPFTISSPPRTNFWPSSARGARPSSSSSRGLRRHPDGSSASAVRRLRTTTAICERYEHHAAS